MKPCKITCRPVLDILPGTVESASSMFKSSQEVSESKGKPRLNYVKYHVDLCSTFNLVQWEMFLQCSKAAKRKVQFRESQDQTL